MQSSAAGGGERVILILANESKAAELSDDTTSETASPAPERRLVQFERVAELAALSAPLRRGDSSVFGVVLDPELAAPDERAALQLALQLQRPRRQPRVVLYADASAGALHAVRRLVACLRCEPVVRSVDPMPVWAAHAPAPPMVPSLPREALEQLARLPARFRHAWVETSLRGGTVTVKGVAALASVKRRTLERAHEKAGLWTPARLLRALVVDEEQGTALPVTVEANGSARDAALSHRERCG